MLKSDVLKIIRSKPELKRAIMDIKNVSQYTVEKWIKENNSTLTEYKCLLLIGSYLHKDPTDLVEKSEQLFKSV